MAVPAEEKHSQTFHSLSGREGGPGSYEGLNSSSTVQYSMWAIPLLRVLLDPVGKPKKKKNKLTHAERLKGTRSFDDSYLRRLMERSDEGALM